MQAECIKAALKTKFDPSNETEDPQIAEIEYNFDVKKRLNHKNLMDYQSTIDYLFQRLPSFQRIGKAAYKSDIGNITKACEILENPHRKFKSIHVAGTNGKGSTSNMIASILQHAGYKVGLYTSPHIKDLRERIKINDNMISKKRNNQFCF